METELIPFPRGNITLLRAASQLALYYYYTIVRNSTKVLNEKFDKKISLYQGFQRFSHYATVKDPRGTNWWRV